MSAFPPKLKNLLLPLATATLLTAVAGSGLLSPLGGIVSDGLYQQPSALGDEIVLINIDQRALEEFGPFPWSREILTTALEYLNADPNSRPAVIGVDVLFAGETDPQGDARLVAVAGSYDNVVTATAATFGTDLVTSSEDAPYMDDYAVLAYDEPFPALKEVTTQGHINAMLDYDGILRHAIWQVDLPNGDSIPSFHQQIYKKYMLSIGEEGTSLPPTDIRHRWYVPMQGTPGAFDNSFSVKDLVLGDLPRDFFADKIVLIGPYAAGMQDSFPTSIDHATLMYGIEFQANAIQALINGALPQEVTETPQLVVLFLLSFLALLWFKERKMLSATILWLALCGGWIALCVSAFSSGYVLYVLYVPLAITICYVVTVARNYIHAATEKRRITTTFQRYVAPEIVTELLKGDPATLELGGKLTDIAVLFVDLRGFTTMSEGLDPATVVEIINRYLTLTSDCILQNNGTLDKFVGDCTMAFWGAPLPQEDCIFKAVKTALAMVEGAAPLSAALQEHFGRSVDFGIGVHFGPAVVGNIGSPSRMDYTAIGDTVNTAARLESNAPGGKILVSHVVADALKDRIAFTSLGDTIRLKGKSQGFEILQVEGFIEPKRED